MSDFSIVTTGDVVTGDHIRFEEGVFGGSFKKPKFLGNRTIEGIVIKDSYGADKQQHTFTIEVTASSGYDPLEVGTKIRRKGRNVYRNGTMRKPWDDESAREDARAEKHERGDIARSLRDWRRENESK